MSIKKGKYNLEIDEFRLNYLRQIVEATNAKIVLSSTWRSGFTKINNEIVPKYYKSNQLMEIFHEHNLKIYDITPGNKNRYREEGILEYLEKTIKTKVIAVSANSLTNTKEEYLSYGFDEYIEKPIKKQELESILNKYFNK